MEDHQIVELYWARSEEAITQTSAKYGAMLGRLSTSLLHNTADAEECVNDTYLEAWNRMPDDRPAYLGAYLAKIIRCLSVSRWRHDHREKRGGVGAITVELTDCIPDGKDLSEDYENGRLARVLHQFLEELGEEKRYIFVRRYFYSDEVAEIAAQLGIGVSKVKTTLFRLRKALKQKLDEEDLPL